MSEASKELVSRLFEQVFNRKNFDVCHELVADDYVEHALAPFGDSEPGHVLGPRHIRAVVVAALVLTEGTNLGKLNGLVPPTGKRFSARQSHWFRVEQGKLAEHWATRDDLTVMLQLGVVPRPGLPRPGPPV
jgi:hypothetical protein